MISDKPGVILKYSDGNSKTNTLKSCVVLPILNKWSFSNLVVSANIEILKFDTHTFYSLHASFPLPTLVGDRVAYSVVSCQLFCRPLLFTYWSFPFWSLYCLSFNLRILVTNWHFRSIVFLFYFNTRIVFVLLELWFLNITFICIYFNKLESLEIIITKYTFYLFIF
jgi:hypothetical protein